MLPVGIGHVQPMIILVKGQRLRGQGDVAEERAARQVVDPQRLARGHVESVTASRARRLGVRPAPLDDGIGDRGPEVRRARHLVAARQPDAPGHGVLGEVRVGELVDGVGLAVLPVLQELGGRARVVDLVEVHAHRLVEAVAAHEDGRQDEARDDEDVEPVDAPAGLGLETSAPVGPDGGPREPHHQPVDDARPLDLPPADGDRREDRPRSMVCSRIDGRARSHPARVRPAGVPSGAREAIGAGAQ